MNKKQFFKDKVKQVTYSIWDSEFKLAKSRQVREGVRQDRDRAVEAINQVDARLLAEKNKEARKNLEAERALLSDKKTRYEAQLDMIDKQINGFAGSETHEPVQGILELLASLNELKTMYKDYLKKV